MQMVVTQGLKFVMLPFKIPRDLPHGTTVEWRHNSVKVYKCIAINFGTQHQPRRDRARMDGYPLTTGDFSLTLRHPHLSDSGVYTCTVNNTYRDILLQKVVTLSVTDNEVGVLEVTQGERSVLLPFQTTADLRQGVTVEWTRSDSKHTKVCVFQKSQSQPDKQHQGYRGRAEMDEDALRTGDFSLTLKDLRLTDSGVYTCTVYNKNGHMLLQKSVTLSVRATLKGAMADMLARLRRRRRAPKSEIKVEKRNRNQEQERLTAEETV
ncbi:matrix remodeling-associated protein 8-like [Oreochromis niloticus]|uniref:matrix remodeling-associated protein 8-like n=1 Tax=Oreochromis niloticus TaxID=8128 RepID=UPI000904D885|nr:matrix remodeling-associated protein 8-like [Oreochromis niloticus]